MRRRTATALLAAIVLAGCAGGDRPKVDSADAVQPDREVPPALLAFLRRVVRPGATPFTASYQVLQKLGSTTEQVTVDSAPPSWRIDVGDLVVVGGATRATCRRSAGTCRRGVSEPELSGYGIFSRSFSTGPVQALQTAARREGAGAPIFSSRTLAGVHLDCVAIPIGAATPTEACLTPDGVFGLVDDPSKRIELTSYSTAPPPPIELPYPLD
ncbi:MAG: hypothetical protein JF603_09840 [Acidobacteria bacterium]|nr:hypothetical protein [Acidobacteriota bacterium]